MLDHLYRIVQEGLTNARKHAPGAAVTLTVSAPEDHLHLEVRSLAPVAVLVDNRVQIALVQAAGEH
ncbi:MAG: hypothetical protein M3550_13890 [Actinomycetota bacterium]|nr:hypothetical protein [Actinomycetota bacterium]